MTSTFCSKGHENPNNSRFCLHCGEKLENQVTYGIQPGQTLGDRYVIVRQLGKGGFGITYLAEDVNRFREPCVLKEFSPQVQTPYVLQKAEELFQREATVLYKLQHPQIPRFRELFRTNLDGKEYLFLVQDFVEGETYSSLLNTRLHQGSRFTEAEVRQLLLQLLPVLEYIHSLGVIHRDISPDNLILRNLDQLPILIDFGGVKQVVAIVASQYYNPNAAPVTPAATLLGKIGYAPPEQMQTGLVEPHSDLYALAATIVVLLTGKQPQELIDSYNLTWQWRRFVNLSPTMGAVLDKMLSHIPSDRYQSARQVLLAFNPPLPSVNFPPTQPVSIPQPEPTKATVSVSPPPPLSPSSPPPTKTWWTPGKTFLVSLIVVTAGGLGWWGTNNLVQNRQEPTPSQPTASPTVKPSSVPQFSAEERARKQRLLARRLQLDVDSKFYESVVNQVFWDRNPSVSGRDLTNSPEDESLRARWDKVAAEVLEKLSPMSIQARRQLGTFTQAERDRSKVEVNNINVGSRSLYDLGDAPFFLQFPEYRGKNFIEQPIGQVWQGFVSDKLSAILAGSAFQRISFDSGEEGKTVSGTLKAANGKVFIAKLLKEQKMEVKLQANSKVLLSIYTPSGSNPFLEDSTQRTFFKTLDEGGYYEFVVVSTASESVDYQLTITAEGSAVPTPIATATPIPITTPTTTTTPTPTPEITATP
ncbi:MAG: protein kinase [Cyanomargarita calcarea GSE-NOS-MK-12-04C]|jgi:serine/threonine-protein kinase|uniref:non-specific serine/threonine protein kinase n=1 Tax=Cyanomargarita calcarea GSE-NOS-MK-12-04C TaxID=2839659 RepID=A0A951QT13_9CYAN|nr:protein kinase [Cyanomargarita calcarea GSE-NOS-MK-12-04C]